MIVTGHWSATQANRLHDYHDEYGLKKALDEAFHAELLSAWDAKAIDKVDFEKLFAYFNVWKNDPFSQPTDYGTWELNHDPRQGDPDIEVGALCMSQATTNDFGAYPFTIAHAWMMAGIWARIAHIKNLDLNSSFGTDVEPSVLQNGPIFTFSTHGERAIQTYDPGPNGASDDAHAREFGYFLNSGDPDLRWDLTILDPSQLPLLKASLANGDARALAKSSAAAIREVAHLIKAAGFTNLWGLDGGITP